MKPILYSIVDPKRLSDMLETFNACIGISIQALDEKGQVLLSAGKTTPFCSLFKKNLPSNENCAQLHASASQKAMALGEPFIFSCHANLIHIVFPLVNQNTLFGSILAGPFLMDQPDSILISDIAKRYDFTTEELLNLYDEAASIAVIPPATVTHLSHLLFYMFSDLISGSRQQLILNSSKLYQQSKINESIQMYKTSGEIERDNYPYEKERLLVSKLKTGDVAEAKALLNDLLGYVFFSGGSRLDVVKSRALELCSLLSRAAIEGGATSDSILKINNQLLTTLPNVKNIDDLCYQLQDAIDIFNNCMFEHVNTKNNDIIKKAIGYISQNFSKQISLQEVSAYVHLNSSYFSTIFKQATGSTFKEYLNMVRIEESKRLLANTNYSLMDISVACGFDDQSYFSKVFKKHTGLTPKQYR